MLEEASRLDEQVFTEVIAPLLGVEGTSLLAISTPMSEDNQYSRMIEMEDDEGNKLFKSLQITLMCDQCVKEKKTSCIHKQHELPPWKSAKRQDLVQKLMENEGAMAQRELFGVITGSENCAFSVEALDDFAKSTFVMNAAGFIKFAWIAIDPNGGGNSGMAFVSGFFTQHGTLVVRFKYYPLSYSVFKNVTRQLILGCRASVVLAQFGSNVWLSPQKNALYSFSNKLSHRSKR